MTSRIPTFWARLVKHWLRARRVQHAAQTLSVLDDHQLRDIGLTRDQIVSAARGRWPRVAAQPPAPRCGCAP